MKRATLSLHTLTDSNSHLDLFLQTEAPELLSYSCASSHWSLLQAGQTVDFRQKPAHRAIYLDYQGPIPGNRGQLQILWQGDYKTEQKLPEKKKSIVRLSAKSYVLCERCFQQS